MTGRGGSDRSGPHYRGAVEISLLAFGVWNEKILPFLEEQVEGFLLGFVVGKGDEVGMRMGHGSDLQPEGG